MQKTDSNNQAIVPSPQNINTIYCVGRNYVAHAKELNNPIPKSPLFFTKVTSTVVALDSTDDNQLELPLSLGRCDFETELVIRLNKPLYQANNTQAVNAISHYGVALDLTLRERQQQLKQQGHPWTLAKNFINACPISTLKPISEDLNLQQLTFELKINGNSQQRGRSQDMIFPVIELISLLSQQIPLCAGDIILTGTPEGVGPLEDKDQLELYLDDQLIAKTLISRNN